MSLYEVQRDEGKRPWMVCEGAKIRILQDQFGEFRPPSGDEAVHVFARISEWTMENAHTDYEQLTKKLNYHAPAHLRKMLKPHLPPSQTILDMGAGTGLLGAPLIKARHTLDGMIFLILC